MIWRDAPIGFVARCLLMWAAIIAAIYIVAPSVSEALWHGNPPQYVTAAPW